MNTALQNKCAHENCTCPAASDSRYCSPACESGKGSESACGCGHADCMAAQAAA